MAAPNTPFVWGPGGAALSPASVASQRKIAEALMAKGMDYSPIQHPTQGLARVAQAMLGGYEGYRADKSEREGQSQVASLLSGITGGAGAPAAASAAMPGAMPAVADDATVQPGTTAAPASPDFGNFSKAIASIESGNRYDALGPQTRTGDRAYGKYQVMGANVGPWTQEVLGKAMTPEQFLRDPDAQEAVFRAKFGNYAQKFGPEGAAKAWFAGEKGVNNPNARDILGTSVSGYAQKFNSQLASLGGAPAAGAPAPVADPAAVPPGQTMAPTPQMQAPPQQQVAQAPTAAPAPAGGLSPRAQQLMAAAMSPWATDGQRQVANAMLQREMQQADPLRRLQMEKAQIEIDLARNPRPEFGFQTAGDQLFRTNKRDGSVTPIQQVQKPTTAMQEYEAAVKQGYNGTFQQYQIEMKKAGANNVNLNTVEGLDQAQVKARIAIDTESAKEVGKQALAGQRLSPLLDQVERLADKTPGGWAGPISASLSRMYAAAGWEPTEGMTNAELLQSISQRLVPIVREPGPTSERELGIYLRAVPGLMQSPEGRRKVVQMTRSIIERSNQVAKVYRQHVGSPDLYEKLAELDKPIFSDADRRALIGPGNTPEASPIDDLLKKYGPQ